MITSLSFPDDDKWVLEEVKKMGGAISPIIVAALKEMLLMAGNEVAKEKMRPEWFVPGKDYSHMSEKTRERLRRFGYEGS